MRLGACGLPPLGAAAGSISPRGERVLLEGRDWPQALREVTQQGCVRRAPHRGDKEKLLAAS